MKGSRLVSIDHNQFELNWVGIWARSTRANISCNNFIDNSGYHVDLEWDSRLLMLPFVFYWKPVFSENYWDDWTDVSPRPINGHFVLWLKIGDLSIMLYVSDIVQYDQHPAQEPYDIGG
jgi:hypothetical protein